MPRRRETTTPKSMKRTTTVALMRRSAIRVQVVARVTLIRSRCRIPAHTRCPPSVPWWVSTIRHTQLATTARRPCWYGLAITTFSRCHDTIRMKGCGLGECKFDPVYTSHRRSGWGGLESLFRRRRYRVGQGGRWTGPGWGIIDTTVLLDHGVRLPWANCGVLWNTTGKSSQDQKIVMSLVLKC